MYVLLFFGAVCVWFNSSEYVGKKYPNNKCPAGAECVERFSTDTYSYSEVTLLELILSMFK